MEYSHALVCVFHLCILFQSTSKGMDSLLLPPPASPYPSQNVALAVLLIAGRTYKMKFNTSHLVIFFLFSDWSNAMQGTQGLDSSLSLRCVAILVLWLAVIHSQ